MLQRLVRHSPLQDNVEEKNKELVGDVNDDAVVAQITNDTLWDLKPML